MRSDRATAGKRRCVPVVILVLLLLIALNCVLAYKGETQHTLHDITATEHHSLTVHLFIQFISFMIIKPKLVKETLNNFSSKALQNL